MTRVSAVGQLGAALLLLGAAYAIVIEAGLPQRADFSRFRSGVGSRAAPEIGSIGPPFTAFTPAFAPLSLESVRAEVIIINFWATWCPPCRQEMSVLQQLYDSDSTSLRILAINMGESANTVEKWVDELNLSYDVLLDPARIAANRYQVRGGPTTFLLDKNRRIRQARFGPMSVNQLELSVQSLRAQS